MPWGIRVVGRFSRHDQVVGVIAVVAAIDDSTAVTGEPRRFAYGDLRHAVSVRQIGRPAELERQHFVRVRDRPVLATDFGRFLGRNSAARAGSYLVSSTTTAGNVVVYS
ncbi:hypothetical protein BRD01_01130 [Halobacteriales archaeon QS_8_65_32]|nr:MAG: hypothetical protein BRD01_01130 [Halobacteriales archaeon QS_8_65_32]